MTTLHVDPGTTAVAEPDLRRTVARTLGRWPSAGLAVALVRGDAAPRFLCSGVADVASGRPVGEDTVFRIGSLTKTMTAVAVVQLAERGLVDLDAPAADHLRAVRLVPARAGIAQPTVRHLLTHTGGIGYWRRGSDLLLHPGAGSGLVTRGVVPLADYYRGGLPVDVQPGTRWAYSNHGFAVLGQLVEDVSGEALDRYLREHVFRPLGMTDTALVLDGRLRSALATGYALRRRGPEAVRHREVPTPGGGGAYSTARDLARYVAAVLHGGANEHGRVLSAESVASMVRPHFRPDPRAAGMGLGFEPHEEAGRALVGKGGIVAGFLSAIDTAPDAGTGVVVLTNTGALDGRGAAEPLAGALLRLLLALPEDRARDDVVPHPEVWPDLCGWYAPDAGPVTDVFPHLLTGAGFGVSVRRGRLVLVPLTPARVLPRAMVLHPDDPGDPRVYRVETPEYGRTARVVFTEEDPPRLVFDLMSFARRPDRQDPRRWLGAAAAAGAALAVGRSWPRHRGG
ncbi:serine hydrolase domain-containing protein [Geodermatophilus sp. SYSU D01062]